MSKKKDLTNQQFGLLKVIKEAEPHISKSGIKRTQWECKCSCGKKLNVRTYSLTTKNTTSCGCLKGENHNEADKTPEYMTWKRLKQRCNNKNHPAYENYGGRGIKVCRRWLDSYSNFLEDMGRKPSDKHSIERVDVNKGYNPENCVWATNVEQSRNQRIRSTNKSGYKGVSYCNTYKKWVASIRVNKKKKTIGRYQTLEEAVNARKAAEAKYW